MRISELTSPYSYHVYAMHVWELFVQTEQERGRE